MKKIALILVFLLLAAGCRYTARIGNQPIGSGARRTEKRDLPSFTAIDTEGAYDIEVICQKPQSLQIEFDDNLLPLIRTEVVNGILRVRSEKSYNSKSLVALKIAVPNLESITSMGTGKIQVSGLRNDRFGIHSMGATLVDASGETKQVEINSTGAGRIDTHNLHAGRAIVELAGAASIDVYASEQLNVTATGVGRVNYSGDPKVVDKNVIGAAVVSKQE